ncbi:MAG: dehydrogenase [Acidimicrobiales bacterium]
MIIRSRAPLRLSLAGGGTDIAEYADIFGGGILNSTINMYAHATITPRDDGKIVLHAVDRGDREELDAEPKLDLSGPLLLARGVYNRIVADYNDGVPLSFELTTTVDAPAGSGLGSSSTLVVAIIGAFAEWLRLPLGEYDVAHLAYVVERIDLGQAGGRQDQYAAAFGGWNFMEFYRDDKVIVNPLRVRDPSVRELEFKLVLYYTGTSRLSSRIIEHQISNLQSRSQRSLEGMHHLRDQAYQMKEALLTGKLDRIGEILDFGWESKKATAADVSNDEIDQLYSAARGAGATGGKISGAGGGGYMMFYCPGNTRFQVIDMLREFGGEVHRLEFRECGASSWTTR